MEQTGSTEPSPDLISGFFEVKLDLFDGPIDLLLHLVKQRELEIERVSLAQVTAQYLHCIEQMRELDLEVAAEYLVVAATLVSIKASSILADPLDFENIPEDQMPDPHRELLLRLREAQVYKEGAQSLAARDLLGVDVFSKSSTLGEIENPEETLCDHDAMLLGQAFRKLLERTGASRPLLEISLDSVTVVERMVNVLDTLKRAQAPLDFTRLIPDLSSRGSLIVSFIALLELAKRRAIFIKQDDSFGTILVGLSGEDFDQSGMSSEFDASASDQVNVTANG